MEKDFIYIEFEVGVDGIKSLDDCFYISLPITNDEIDELISIGKKQLWKEENEPWDYIHDFMPELYTRFVSLAKREAIKKYGDDAQNAYYEFFLPNEIIERIRESEEATIFFNAQKRMQANVHYFWKYDLQRLKEEKCKGRWKWRGPILEGVMTCGGMNGAHHFNVSNRIEYSKKYTLRDTIIEIELRGDRTNSLELLTQYISNSKFKNEFEMSIKEGFYGSIFVTRAKDNEMDIEMVIDFFDYL